jgi:hypothetical protein
MRNNDFFGRNAVVIGAKLHLEGPTPIAIVHLERSQDVEANGAKGPQVAEPCAVEKPGSR